MSQRAFGFSFDFFGTTYTQARLQSNGHLDFGPANYFPAGQDGGNQAHPENNSGVIHNSTDGARIDFNWDDLDPSASGEVRVGTRGTAPNREFVIDFNLVPEFNAAHVATVQTILHEGSNDITMNFIDVGDDLAARNGVAVGIQGSATEYLQVGYWGGRGLPLSLSPADLSLDEGDPNYAVNPVASVGAPANGEALLFHPVPEPASFVLLTVAGLGLLASRRRRRS